MIIVSMSSSSNKNRDHPEERIIIMKQKTKYNQLSISLCQRHQKQYKFLIEKINTDHLTPFAISKIYRKN